MENSNSTLASFDRVFYDLTLIVGLLWKLADRWDRHGEFPDEWYGTMY